MKNTEAQAILELIEAKVADVDQDSSYWAEMIITTNKNLKAADNAGLVEDLKEHLKFCEVALAKYTAKWFALKQLLDEARELVK